ncbi:hypothetical protein PF049_10765 [Erythrobacteraceae bacterium WH01K]|nr:hypothetical protein PF049_10765 [Erythrobacteraceae bacterium WH01K]
MTDSRTGGLARKLPALLAVLVPVGAGLLYLWAAGAPGRYIAINSGALIIASGWILAGRSPRTLRAHRIMVVFLLALCFVPLVTGPWVNGIARWLPVGPLSLHAGSLAFPAIAVLAARDREFAAPILLAAILAASLQPDAAFGFAAVFAAAGLHDRTRDWRIGLVCIVGFAASLIMAVRGELPPQPFVERVIVDAMQISMAAGIGLMLAMAAGFALVLFAAPFYTHTRFALAGAWFGFAIIALISHYPGILIGYGASPILGFGLALGLSVPPQEETPS